MQLFDGHRFTPQCFFVSANGTAFPRWTRSVPACDQNVIAAFPCFPSSTKKEAAIAGVFLRHKFTS
jgi:hypothetical protein